MKQLLGRLSPPFLFVVLAFAVYLAFGLPDMTKYITADEHFWLPNYGSERIQDYWKAVAEGDWEDTRVNDKPGITLAYFSGIALPFAQDLINRQILFTDGTIRIFDPAVTEDINFLFRLPLFLVNGLFALFFFFLLKKITSDEWIASFAAVFILLSPVLLGISQIVNPDTLFYSFGVAAFFSFFAYVRFRERRYVILSTIFFGLTLASKYVGVIFFPFFLLMIGFEYLFRMRSSGVDIPDLARLVKRDLAAYYTVVLGGIAIFAILMPAALVEPRVLFESTVGFEGMGPIFGALVVATFLLFLDAQYRKSRTANMLLRFIAPRLIFIERALFALLLLTVSFVLINWILRNSLVDLSHIPFDAKTKASFTTDNPYLARFVVEFVPLVFSLTPLTLVLLIVAWTQSFFGVIRDRLFAFTISAFILVFYVAVIHQGLLVTTRYSILLFPLALVLGALALRTLFDREHTPSRARRFSTILSLLFLAALLLSLYVMEYHASLPTEGQIALESGLGKYLFIVLLGAALFASAFVALSLFIFTFLRRSEISLASVSVILLLMSAASLFLARPHYFIYVNDLLPKRYLISGSWGYGGYEAAAYLNKKPNAQDLTLWTDAHGVCEFFVGKCIHKQKLDIEKYPVDYILRTLRGQLAPRFPYEIHGAEWTYAVGGREKNFIRIYRNYAR